METGNSSFTVSILNSLATLLSFKSIQDAFGGRCKFIICGGAELTVEIEDFFHAVGLKVLNGYGLTEGSPVVTVNRPKDYKIGTVGKLLANVQVKIKEDGEIFFKGPNMTSGYFANEAATSSAIDQEGWFHTGDIGYMDKEGFLKIIDRKDDIIILSSGDNVPPQKIETLLIADEFIDQALVIGDGKDFLAALIVPSFSNLRNWADGEKIKAKDDLDLISNSKVISFLGDRLKVINEELPYFEQIKKFALMSRDFRIELGEMTCTHKLRRKIICEKYGNLIKSIYQEA
jgi:long-chain acyl-CoA synthetase